MDVNCPTCGKKMKKTKYDTYMCVNEDCKEKYIAVPMSIFGVTEKK